MKNSSNAFRSLLTAVAFAACVLTPNGLHAQKDAKGCTDSPYISRFPGTFISMCDAKDDDSFSFIIGAGKPYKTIEGKKFHVMYLMAPSASNVQVARNLNTAMQQANWTNDYMSGATTVSTWHNKGAWLGITIGGGYINITSVALANLTQDVTATAADLSKGIDASGHAVVPGILFDTGKADVKDESKPALDEVAKLLNQNSALKLWVVGHTDNVGGVASNLDLSKRRAAAVIAILVSKYHIAPARLDPFGNGPYAPVASNDQDEGRTQNRRVEIVKQ